MVAPVARIPEPLAGIVRATRVDVQRRRPRNRPPAWCDALLQREGPIATSGDKALLTAVIGAPSKALRA